MITVDYMVRRGVSRRKKKKSDNVIFEQPLTCISMADFKFVGS